MSTALSFSEVFEDDLHSRLQNPDASFLLALWRMASAGRDIPLETELPQGEIARIEPDLMVLRPAGPGDWRYERYGAEIARHAGFDMTGRRVSDFQGPIGAFFRRLYLRATAERRPLASVHRFGPDHATPLWERLILPVGDGASVLGLYVVNRVRQPAWRPDFSERSSLGAA